ncbi:MAG: CsiV family protein [Gammaproteobacteria bacterium]|nr:CsiV family protein [Gammaproteobacteria bacterium]
MVFRFLTGLLFLLTGGQFAVAQTFSYDGNRWYEIEVSIFSNENPLPHNEMLIPDKTELSYPEIIRPLTPASQMYRLDFETLNELPPFQSTLSNSAEEQAFIGPLYETGDALFRLTDFTRDPFIALGTEQAEFQALNTKIIESPDYRLLFHAVWRQPVLNLIQSEAIVVTGGDPFGSHHELEGSLRFSYNLNRVDVEARLWLVEFSTQETPGGVLWQLPVLPGIAGNTGNISLTFELPVNYLSYMDQERAMVSNELYYMDHPDFGLLVQIRPYQLPEPVSFSFQ